MSHPENLEAHLTFAALAASDAQLAPLADSPYTKAQPERVAATKAALEANGFVVTVVKGKTEAFNTLKELIPAGSTVNTAHSTSLEEVGFMHYLKDGEHGWENTRGVIMAETDFAKQAVLRRTIGSTVDVFLTSMSAVTETGVLMHADASGSKTGPVAFTAGKVIVLVGSNKIVADGPAALERTKTFCVAGASAYARAVFGIPGMAITYLETIAKANPFNAQRIHVVLTEEALGF